MSAKFNCPHCGGNLKVIGQRDGTFEHTTPTIDAIAEKPSLKWVLFGKGRAPAPAAQAPTITVRVEEINRSQNQIKYFDFPEAIEWERLIDIAKMVELGYDWTRDNLTDYAGINPSATRRYIKEFKKRQYLTVTPNNRSVITTPGRRFLRAVLSMSK